MEDKKFDDLMKQAEELAKSAGYDPKSSNSDSELEVKIMRKIQKALEENDLDIVITPMMYNPEDFMPALGVLVKTESGALQKKYTISITKDSAENK